MEALVEPLSAKRIREIVGRKDATYFRLNTLHPMMADEIIAPVNANSIRSPKQRYYITEKGSALLGVLKKENSN